MLGDPFDDATTMGPLNNEPVAAKMDEHVADAVERGASAGHRRRPRHRLPHRPLLAAHRAHRRPRRRARGRPRRRSARSRRSWRSTSLEHAITLDQRLPYGLLAAVYTADLSHGLEFADRVRTGWVNINESSNYWEAHLPFGGRPAPTAASAGSAATHVMQSFTELQTIVLSPHTGS